MMEGLGTIGKIAVYQSLMAMGDAGDMETAGALKYMRRLVDVSFALRQQDGLMRAVMLGDTLLGAGHGPKVRYKVHYTAALAWEKLRLLREQKGTTSWDWERPEIEKELIHLRRSLSPETVGEMSRETAARILSNTAALYNHVGRFSEALEHWDRAIKVLPSYSLAHGKKGYALTHYAHILRDRRLLCHFMRCARGELKSALSSGLYEEAREQFQKRLKWIESGFSDRDLSGDLSLFGYCQGSSEAELRYRRWCLGHRLFLNPLNDLGPYPAAARDTLSVPHMVRGREGRSLYHGFFNQMKQAFVSARYIYYEGLHATEPHFSDRDVALFDTADYPSYSLAAEKVKAAFSMAYALFDKMAGFLNLYMGLSIPDNEVDFRTFWYEGRRKEFGLRGDFRHRGNWPLRGLFWLSKDLYAEGFEEAIEPEAARLAEIRSELERRYLKLHEDYCADLSNDTDVPPGSLVDSMAYSVYRGDFESKALQVLKLARSALMYLCFAVHLEQKAQRDEDESLPAIRLGIWEDSWKI